MYMCGNDSVIFKYITFNFIYEDNTISITKDNSIFSQFGDSLTDYTFNSVINGNTILNKIITAIQSKGNVSIKLVIDILY